MTDLRSCRLNRHRNIPHTLPHWIAWLAFGVGLSGAISLRLILLAKAYRPELIRLFWYMGVCGNMVFFMFRSYITRRRRRLIIDLSLVEKMKDQDNLCPEDYEAIKYLISSLSASKEQWNYAVIFVFSLAAIAWDLWFNMTTP